jgi:steroid delta-isomerase-like uncharacterized protein
MVPENEAIVRRFFEELWNEGDLGVADELIAADHVHDVGGEELRGPDGVKGAVTWLRTAFPDLRFEIDSLISDGDQAAVRWTASGTHLGPFAGVPPTGRRVEWTGSDWFRLHRGRIIDAWVIADGEGLQEQLTATSEPPRT